MLIRGKSFLNYCQLTEVYSQILCFLDHSFKHLTCDQLNAVFSFLRNQPLQYFLFLAEFTYNCFSILGFKLL